MKTIQSIRVERNPQGSWENVEFSMEPKGDGTIPEYSTILKGSEIHPVQQYHESLYIDNDVKMRLKLELTRA